MAFKMKGPSLYRNGNGNMADGKSKSAVFQMKSPIKHDDAKDGTMVDHPTIKGKKVKYSHKHVDPKTEKEVPYIGTNPNKMKSPIKQDVSLEEVEASEMQQQSAEKGALKPQKGAWGKFLSETREKDFLNEDGSLNVEAHKKAIDDSLIRNGLKPQPSGWVDPLLGEAAATAAGEFVGEATRLPEVTVTPNRTREQIIQELKDTYGEAYLDMDQEQIDYIVKMQMKMDAEGTEGEKVTP
tara:strand:+ start:199 stop:915 length:717 start_codon:yes stop_codon:yes gene_type:complete